MDSEFADFPLPKGLFCVRVDMPGGIKGLQESFSYHMSGITLKTDHKTWLP